MRKNCLLVLLTSYFAIAATMSVSTLNAGGSEMSTKSIGFLGCGKISSAVARGYAGAGPESRPRRIIISPRNEAKSRKLFEEYPDIIEIASSNEEVVRSADIVFVGLLPGPAREVLPNMPFNDKHIVISMMAAVDFKEVVSLVGKVDEGRIVRIVPLPSNSQRSGPILVHPSNEAAQSILSIVGTPVVCLTEAEMKPLVSLTGHISSFFELMRVTQDWAVQNGVESETARAYVSSFYSSLAASSVLSTDSFAEMREEAATPGGLNEQSLRTLGSSEHFSLAEKSLQEILERLQGVAQKK